MERRGLAVGALAAIAIGVVVWAIAARVRGLDGPREGAAAADARDERGAARAVGGGGGRGAGVAAPAGAPEGALRLEGQVIDPDERPVGGATVTIATEPPRTVVTEADGSFAFDGLRPWTYSLRARRDDEHAGPVLVRVREATEPVTLRVRLGLTLAVRVVDAETGAPVPGAQVSASDVEATTGLDGVAELRVLDDPWIYVAADADGYDPGMIEGRLPDDPGGRYDATIRLERDSGMFTGATIVTGTVVDPDGAPVAAATVTAELGEEALFQAETDAAGRWRIERVPAGTLTVVASAQGFVPSAAVALAVDGRGRHEGVELRLVAGATIAGVVVDRDGVPAPGAKIEAIAQGKRAGEVVADARGQFAVHGLAATAHLVSAELDDRAAGIVRVTPGTDAASAVRLVLEDGLITGTVIDTLGESVADAQVVATARGGRMAATTLGFALTDGGGGFVLGPLAPGDYDLSVYRDGILEDVRRGQVATAAAVARAGTRDVRVVIAATGTVTGVVHRGGAPVPVFAVAVVVGALDPLLGLATPRVVRSADGRFTIRNVPSGGGVLAVVVEGAGRIVVRGLVVEAGRVTDVGRLEPPAAETVRGRVRDASGAAVAGATVRLGRSLREPSDGLVDPWRAALQDEHVAVAGADGRFAITGVTDPRALKLVATHPRLGRSPVVPVPARGDVVLTIEPTGAIAGVVAGAGGFVMVAVAGTDASSGGRARVRAGPGGRFRIDGLSPGRYRVWATEAVARGTPAVEVEVAAGETADVALAFVDGEITLAVRIGDRGCSFVTLVPSGGTSVDEVRAMGMCAGDEVALDGLEPGDYRLCVDFSTCKPITIAPAPARQTVDVTGW